ncbi:RICIN domain-containing protein [Streptomyces sp. PR69]|uniref:RICIN domain-containing protein n=1 Tax=Streptomyces sp. PR69 TaxID=2984950 RepID=UPI002263F071|nr:RICIN domain-containing protein [Streptomyces sp. PR69]
MTSTAARPRRRPGQPPAPLRLLAAALVTCCIALGISLSPSAAPAAHAAENCATPLQCATIQSVGNGRMLDVQNGSRGDGAYIVTNSVPGYHQSWRLNVDGADSTFSIVNNATGKCIGLSWPALRQQTCRGQESQKWYFQPVSGSGDAFMIRNASDDSCLDLLLNAQYDDAWTGKSSCHGRVNQQWKTAEGAWDLAVDHAARQCQKTPSSCSWAVTHEAPAAPLPTVCASAVWYNNTAGPVTQSFSVNQTTGWSSSIGTTLSTDLEAGAAPALQTRIGSTLSFTNTWSGSASVDDGVEVHVPAAHYGWVTLSVLARKVTGTWTFDARGLPWQADDTITVPVKDDPSGGATVYIANTSETFTSCS